MFIKWIKNYIRDRKNSYYKRFDRKFYSILTKANYKEDIIKKLINIRIRKEKITKLFNNKNIFYKIITKDNTIIIVKNPNIAKELYFDYIIHYGIYINPILSIQYQKVNFNRPILSNNYKYIPIIFYDENEKKIHNNFSNKIIDIKQISIAEVKYRLMKEFEFISKNKVNLINDEYKMIFEAKLTKFFNLNLVN